MKTIEKSESILTDATNSSDKDKSKLILAEEKKKQKS